MKRVKQKVNLVRLALAMAGCLIIGSFGSVFTNPKIFTWYSALAKPSWTPPNWLFAPVWTTLFILMGVALYLVWQKYPKHGSGFALKMFGVQFALNVLWSFLFFGLESPLYGFAEIIVLWIAIAVTIFSFYKVSKPAAYALVPYIAWVTVAALLNYSVMVLNA